MEVGIPDGPICRRRPCCFPDERRSKEKSEAETDLRRTFCALPAPSAHLIQRSQLLRSRAQSSLEPRAQVVVHDLQAGIAQVARVGASAATQSRVGFPVASC